MSGRDSRLALSAAAPSPVHAAPPPADPLRRSPITIAVPGASSSPARCVAVVQSNYIPWKGYFDLINAVDEFVLFDDVQYTRRDWRNRNRIKTRDGLLWLSIPVSSKGRYTASIREIEISDPQWNSRHWKTIAASYSRARHFRTYAGALEELYLGTRETHLSQVNHRFLATICQLLGIRTRLRSSEGLRLPEERTERIVALCRELGAGAYLSGPSAMGYLDPQPFRREGLELRYFDYAGYAEYEQLFPPFEHHVSILDLLLNQGPAARRYLLTS